MAGTAVTVAVVVLLAVLLGWPDAGRRLRSRRAPVTPEEAPGGRDQGCDPALLLDLVAAALAAGAPPQVALTCVAGAVGGDSGAGLEQVAARLRLGSGWARAWSSAPAELEVLGGTLTLAVTAGAPGAGLLRDAASELRRRRHRSSQLAAARLGVRMVLPLGLCVLPAFVAWAVVPVVLSLADQLLAG